MVVPAAAPPPPARLGESSLARAAPLPALAASVSPLGASAPHTLHGNGRGEHAACSCACGGYTLHTLHTLHAACFVALSPWLCSEVSCAHSRAVPSHATDPASAFTFHGAVGDGRASFGSMRGEAVHANAAHFSSVASPRALPGGSDASAPPVDLAALVQLTAWIKALGELIRMRWRRLTVC